MILHYLREGSEKTKLERQKLESENELLKAKKTTLDIAAKDHDQLARVLDAFKLYSGDDNE